MLGLMRLILIFQSTKGVNLNIAFKTVAAILVGLAIVLGMAFGLGLPLNFIL